MVATARIFPALLLGLTLVAGATPARAQETAPTPLASAVLPAEPDAAATTPAPGTLRAAVAAVPMAISGEEAIRPSRAPRRVLTASYLGLGVLQTLDAHSTFRALDSGMEERNPLMRWASDHPAAFVALKGGATAGTILVAEKIRKKHPKRAIAFITAINAAYAVVVLHNYRASAGR